MGIPKTKLGARILSEGELNTILPNAESIYGQIQVFRDGIPDESVKQSDEQCEVEQKTNNIGIMGRRGTGKTSILKTFYHKLKTENNNAEKKDGDILLPIIIPENMSSGTTLMDVILGRLKSIVEERQENKTKKKYSGDCIYSGQDSLEKLYNELVKQYCYIKKDYRDILIQQFTTEQNYVDKTKKVFSSDSEFLKMFNQFVTELLGKGKNEKKENFMMFLFIDDVDLSTNRCMDIVRTLLVYLSNPRIVTFISGDIETFEEELTLEFLRQEETLREDAFRETYYSANNISGSSLLERKKELAYEYLKKVIPPVYRRPIRYWALEERGNYRIIENEEDEQKSLVELLVEVTKEKLGDLYFVYKEDDNRKNMRLAFHMFDDTSRGLNNVYNVLQEIYNLQKKEKNMPEEEKEFLLWRLIETMVDSKPLYAKCKSDLLKYVIVYEQGRIKVDFTNAYQLLYGEGTDKEENIESGKSVKRFSSTDCFAIYFLIDFAANLFSKKKYENEDNSRYSDLKDRIIQDYLCSEEIDNKIPADWEPLECLVKKQADKDKDTVNSILINFLRKCDFIFVLHIIRCLGRAEIYAILGDKKRFSDKEIVYKIAYTLSRAVQSINESKESIQEYLADLYIRMQDMMLNLLSRLSLDPWVIYGRQLINDAYIEDGMRYMNGGQNLAEASFWNIEKYMNEGSVIEAQWKYLLWAEYENKNARYWIYYERKLRERQNREILFNIEHKETVWAGLTKTIMNHMQEQKVMNRYEVRPLKEVGYDGVFTGKAGKEKNEILVLEQIDEQGLWDTTYVQEKIKPYLEKRKCNIIREMCHGRVIFDATQFVAEAYSEFKNCYKGSAGTALVYGIESKVRRVMSLSVKDEKSEPNKFADGRFYLRFEQVLIIQCLLEEFLYFHKKVVYGKKEARKLLMKVKELPLVLHTSEWSKIDEELQRREEDFFDGNPYFLRDKHAEELEKSETGKKEIKKVWEMHYGSKKNNEAMSKWIDEYLGKIGKNNDMYFQHLVQKEQIKKRKEELRQKLKEEGKVEKEWSDFESVVPEKECTFFFHSYLRCLHVNENEAKKAGTRAEDIVKLVYYMLDSEIKADEMVQNEVYQIISKEIEITEEEFESLF